MSFCLFLFLVPSQIPVEDVSVTRINATVAQVGWEPPDPPNGPISYYTLRSIWLDADDNIRHRDERVTECVHSPVVVSCDGQYNKVTYNFSVLAVNVDGNKTLEGNPSTGVSAEMCKDYGIHYIYLYNHLKHI